jgi:hypothetical protein
MHNVSWGKNMSKSQKKYYDDRIREIKTGSGQCVNLSASKIYDCNILDATYNTSAALLMMKHNGCYIYHDYLSEEDPLSNGTNWLKYGFACVNGKTYKYYYEIKKFGQEVKDTQLEQFKDRIWKAAKLNVSFSNKYIGSNFDEFAYENKIVLKRDMNWAIKMLAHGKIVYREEFPEVILFPIGYKNNPETKLTVDDLFAEDWTIFRGKNLKEVLDDFYAGKTIRRKSWYPEFGLGKYSKDIDLNIEDIQAFDWEVVDVVAEVNKQQQDIKDGKF